MKFVEVKKNSDVNLAGIVAEVDFVNGNVTCVTLVDSTGRTVRIEEGKYCGLRIVVPEPPKKVKRYRVTTTLPEAIGGTIVKEFPDKHSAESHRDAIGGEVRCELTQTLEEVEVFEEA